MGSRSKDFIFKENAQGELKFVGDFDGLYQAEVDPWQQSANSSDMASYYHFSRSRIGAYINKIDCNHFLEVGCGVGHSTQQLITLSHCRFAGADISETAITKAINLYPAIDFYQFDICKELSSHTMQTIGKFDCIILNQVLWYIMHAMPQIKHNLIKVLPPHGHVIFSTAFLNEQRYGREFFVGYQGLVKYLEKYWLQDFELVYHDYDSSDTYQYHDGLVCLKRL